MIAMVLPPTQEKLNSELSTGRRGCGTPSIGGSVPGEPNRKLPRVPISDAVASLSLVRLTSTKRMSVCTCDGRVGSSDGTLLVSAVVAAPWTKTMACCGCAEQAVQTIRLVAPGPTPVSKKDEPPLACTSAIFGSPTASRVIATGDCISCWKPSPISITEGRRGSAEQLPTAATAVSIVNPNNSKARSAGFNVGLSRLCMHVNPCAVMGFVG